MRAVRVLRRIGLTWLAAEFTAAVLASALLIALLPAVLVLLTHPSLPWLALGAVLPVSVPLGGLLAYWSLRIPPDLLRQASA